MTLLQLLERDFLDEGVTLAELAHRHEVVTAGRAGVHHQLGGVPVEFSDDDAAAEVELVDELARGSLLVHARVTLPPDRRVDIDLLDRDVGRRVGGADDQVAHPDDGACVQRPGAEPGIELRAELVGHLPTTLSATRDRVGDSWTALKCSD